MRVFSYIMVIVILAIPFVPAVAQANEHIDTKAQKEADATVADWLEWLAYEDEEVSEPGEDPGAGVYITSYDLDPCERDGRRRWECDITYKLNDGDLCDATIIVRVSRRDKLSSRQTDEICDSEE